MKYKIAQLTRTNSGTYNESGDMLPDMLSGEPCPADMDDLLAWLSEEGYTEADGFAGWGHVLKHNETGELLSVQEQGDA